MIYVLTCHHRTDEWVDVQADALATHMGEPYRLHACVEQVTNLDRFDRVLEAEGAHAPKLNLLAADALTHADPDDLLVFLDSDAWPIADPMPFVRRELAAGAALVAVRRDENLGEPQPHPSFCAITAGMWAEIGGDWSRGHKWRNSLGQPWTDTGAAMIPALDGRRWTPMLRSNTHNPHPVFFAVYGGLIYHHGAGSRITLCRADRARLGTDKAKIREAARRNAALSRSWRERIAVDPDGFWRELVA